jgi:hypothetical protein
MPEIFPGLDLTATQRRQLREALKLAKDQAAARKKKKAKREPAELNEAIPMLGLGNKPIKRKRAKG